MVKTLRGDVIACLAVIAGMAIAGAVVGALWAWIAPPVRSAVAVTKSGKHVQQYLGEEADHYFDAAVLMVGLVFGVAVVAAVLVWQWRQRRGPGMVIGLIAGAIAAAGVSAGVGAILARLRYGQFDLDAVPADHKLHYVAEAPVALFSHGYLQVLTVLFLPAAVAALTYAIMAAASAHDDLGVDSPAPANAYRVLDEV